VQRHRGILQSNLSAIDAMRINSSMDLLDNGRRQPALQGITVTQQMLDMLVTMSANDYRYWRDSNVLVAYDAMMRDRRLTNDTDVANAREALPDRLTSTLTPLQKDAAIAFISPLIAVNIHLDEEQTAQRREQAVSNVKPVVQTVQKGEAILRQGELATPESIEKMQEAGLLRREINAATVVGTGGLVAILMLLLHLYVFRYAPQVWPREKQVLLVALLIVLPVAVARLFLPGHAVIPYLLPLAAVSMLIAVLIDTNVAVLVTLVISILAGLVATNNNLSMDLALYYFIGGLAGIFSLTRVERVTTFARAGVLVALSSFIVVITLRVLSGTPIDWDIVQSVALSAGFNGLVAASLTYAAFSLLGTLFGITTPVQLMELAHPDQPVLRRLMQEAPGTYHHSLVVSNLAERAAEMIGADALLTRVCAYYHDIGKVLHPYYFTENQTGMKNIHDELDPRTSAYIISGHVRDGIELAKKHRLPRRVIDAIPQHHGTMLIKYFYHVALKQDPNTDPNDFKYPGPKPQTKENGILMLADGVEATVRSMAQSGALDKPVSVRPTDSGETPGQYSDSSVLSEDVIADVVHKIINERIEDGQLDECDLTVRDIARIQEAFVSMLKGIYHPRVQYPEAPKHGRQTAGDGAAEAAEPPITPAAASIHNGSLGNGHTANGAPLEGIDIGQGALPTPLIGRTIAPAGSEHEHRSSPAGV
jgi:cyclic-di-AMP phosphodiesterase PgpH